MSEKKHTPGPWRRDKYGHIMNAAGEEVLFRSVAIAAAGSQERIAMAEANTDLAAAAPALLEVATLAAELLTRQGWRADGNDPEAVLLRKARAAIRSATVPGETA